ncbi:hypothetical protein F3Y22_tig00110213pilonHSYRG00282 [Hibiscus syriacus]|uniref:Uncharacterized protein n=1 Tax=Hibiscus syriacus TaxID=106335 RepID=A0A6A3B8X3_HIBSY|nr:hypothetical protein F3Y22_tig00110213pilonHSYRG00282 [Hibiscus syriacus]
MAEIASIFVCLIVSVLIETVATLIHDEYVAIKGVKEDLGKLLDTLETIRAVLEDAEQRSASEAHHGKVCRNRAKIRVASEIIRTSERLDLIAEDRRDFNLISSGDGGRSHSQSPNQFPLTSSFVETTDGGVSVIPIIGMGGLGKTTLAQLIFNDGRVKDHFEYKMWVCVTIDFNLKRILKGIIEFHTQMEVSNNLSFDGLVSCFKDILAGKNFLLVLDDVWVDNYHEWEPLRNILKLGGKGSRVLVTSIRQGRSWSSFGWLKHLFSIEWRSSSEETGREYFDELLTRPLGCLWLFELPKDFGKLVNLIYLKLDEMFWFKCRTLPPGLGNLTRLQNLHAFQVFKVEGKTGHGIGELKDMSNLTGKLHISNVENVVNATEAKLNQKERLEKLVLEWSDIQFNNQEDEVRADRDLKGLQPHSNLKELALHHFKGSNFHSWMTDDHHFLPNLVKLTLSNCTKCTTFSVGQLPCLRELYIKGMLELEEWPEAQCHSLFRLHISNRPKLRTIPELMLNLRALKIKKCDSLKALPFAPSLMSLILIDNLVLENW